MIPLSWPSAKKLIPVYWSAADICESGNCRVIRERSEDQEARFLEKSGAGVGILERFMALRLAETADNGVMDYISGQ